MRDLIRRRVRGEPRQAQGAGTSGAVGVGAVANRAGRSLKAGTLGSVAWRLGLVAWLGLAAGAAVAQVTAAPERANLMTLNASASVDVTLDTLSVTLAVVREGPDATIVQAQLKQALEAALAEARPQAVPGQLDVQTGVFSLSPRYAPPPVRPSAAAASIVAWMGRAEIVVEGRDLQAVARLAGRLTSVSVARVAYTLSREARERAEATATAEAIRRFRERAQSYAQQFGFSGYTIREVQVGLQEPAPFAPMRSAMVRAAVLGAEEPLPVEAGKTAVSSSVSGSVQMGR